MKLPISVLLILAIAGCTTAPVAPTTQQQIVANAVEDVISIGLVPVLTKNSSYIPAAKAVAAALGTFQGATITPENVNAVLDMAGFTPADARTISGIVNAAWGTYCKRYAQQVSTQVRPDVKLFLSAVSAGITNAISACGSS
jgi:hypothetical protein